MDQKELYSFGLTFTFRAFTSCVRVTKVAGKWRTSSHKCLCFGQKNRARPPTMPMLITKAYRQCCRDAQVLVINDRSIFTCSSLSGTNGIIPGRKPENTCSQRIVRSGQSQHLFFGPDNECFGRLGMDGKEIVAVISLPKLKKWYVPLPLLPLRCCDLALL